MEKKEMNMMKLLFEMDAKNYSKNETVFSRPSVRGIIIREGKVAMVHSMKYDYYKFPGGGIESDETQIETLFREVAEESGLQVILESVQEYGYVHRIEKSDKEGIFLQDNYYYLCKTNEQAKKQNLDDYEREEGYTLEFVDPMHAIKTNREAPHGKTNQSMLEREALVLELLMKEGYLK